MRIGGFLKPERVLFVKQYKKNLMRNLDDNRMLDRI